MIVRAIPVTSKIGIYVEPSGGLGGAKYHGAVLAEDLSGCHDVEFVHHQPACGVNSSRHLQAWISVGSRFATSRKPGADCDVASPMAAVAAEFAMERGVEPSLPDVFVNLTHGMPPFCHARHSVLIVLFPFFKRTWMRDDPPRGIDPRRRVRNLYTTSSGGDGCGPIRT